MWVLTGPEQPYYIDDLVFNDGLPMQLRGARHPHKPASTGRVSVAEPDDPDSWVHEYFPSVVGLKWKWFGLSEPDYSDTARVQSLRRPDQS